MAVLVLVPLASYITAGWGAAYGIAGTVAAAAVVAGAGAAGAYIDQTYTYPALFGQKSGGDGPRLDDLRVQAATEGTPYQFTVGTIRIGGVVIWASPLIETEKKVRSGKSSKQTQYSYSVDVAVAFGAGERYITKVWANGKIIYDFNSGTPKYDVRYKEISLYAGDATQPSCPIIEDYEVQTPAYRGTCYMVIQGLQLADFGNSIPQFSALIEQGDEFDSVGVPLPTAIDTIFQYGGWDPDFYDLTGVPTSPIVRGMLVQGKTQLAKALEPILLANRLIIRKGEGKLEILHRDMTDTLTVDPADLGASEDPKEPYRARDKAERDIPSEVSVRYVDCDYYYDTGQKTERTSVAVSNNTTNIDLPLVMKPAEARQLARELLHSGFVESQEFSTTLPPPYMIAQDGDIIDRQLGARTRRIRLTQMDRGVNSAMEVTGYFEQVNTQTADAPTYTPLPPQKDPLKPTTPYVHVLDIPPLRAEDVGRPGVYIGACRAVGDPDFRAVTIYGSDNGTIFTEYAICNQEAVIGTATGVLGNPPAWTGGTPEPEPYQPLVRDDVNTISVSLIHGTLTSVTDDEVLNGKNWMLIGDEIVGFKTATLTAPNTYTLSHLYRGVADTQHACTTHVASEKVCLLSDALRFVEIPIAKRGALLYYKGVPMYGDPEAYDHFTRIWRAENMMCFRPWNIDSSRSGDDIKITWSTDSRSPKPHWTHGGTVDEVATKFVLKIYDGTSTDPQRTVNIPTVADPTKLNEFTYTSAMQSADGHSLGAAIDIIMWKVGAAVAQGRWVKVEGL